MVLPNKVIYLLPGFGRHCVNNPCLKNICMRYKNTIVDEKHFVEPLIKNMYAT